MGYEGKGDNNFVSEIEDEHNDRVDRIYDLLEQNRFIVDKEKLCEKAPGASKEIMAYLNNDSLKDALEALVRMKITVKRDGNPIAEEIGEIVPKEGEIRCPGCGVLMPENQMKCFNCDTENPTPAEKD